MLKNNEFVPQEVELLREIGELKEKIKNCVSESDRKILSRNLNEKSLALAMGAIEPIMMQLIIHILIFLSVVLEMTKNF